MSILKKSFIIENKSLRYLLIARVSTFLAFQMLAVAVGWQIYSLTQMPLYLGLVGLVQFLPMILFTLMVGYVADRYDRKIVVCISQVVESIGIFTLAFASYHGWINKETILIAVFFIGTANAFQGPCMQSLLPNIVSKEVFPRAAAVMASASQFAVIIGPGIGGLLYSLGAPVVYSISGAFALLASVVISLISVRKVSVKQESANLKSLFAGIYFIRSNPIILGAISLDLFAVLLGGATALLPIYASKILIVGPFGLGVLRSTPAVGALMMSFFLAKRPLRRKVGRTMFVAVIFFGVATIIFAVSTSIIISIAALFMLGVCDVISVVIRSTLVQIRTPDNMRGRVSSVNSMFIGTSNQLGEFESGLLASYIGVVPAALLGGIGTIVVVIIWMRLFPELLKADKLQ